MEHYKIGIQILMRDGVSPVLSHLSTKLLGVHKSVKDIEGGFNRWKVALMGAGAVMAGGAILGGLSKIAAKGSELLNQQNQMARLGIAQSKIAAMTANYYASVAKAVPTSTVEEYLATVKELRAVLGSTGEAEQFAPRALMFDALLSNVMGKKVHGELYRLLRAGELKGIATDPAKLNDLIQQAYSYIAAFGGKLTAGMIQNLAVRGGTAWMNADLKKAFGPMAVLAAEMGASGGGGNSSPGVVLYQLQQLMMGAHTLSKQQFNVLRSLGLIDASKVKATGFGGSRYQLAPGAIVGSLQYAGNVPGWAKNVVWPALMKASHGDDKMLQLLLAKIAPTTNMAKAIELFGNPEFLKQQMKDLGLAGKADKLLPAYGSFTANNPKGVREAFENQWQSMLTAIGAPLMKAALPVMREITAVFTKIGQLAISHPTALKIVAEGIAALGIAVAGAGIAAVIAAIGVGGWIAGGLLALGGALLMVPWREVWTGLGKMMSAAGGAISQAASAITSAFDRILAAIRSFSGSISIFGWHPFGGAAPHSGGAAPEAPHRALPRQFQRQGYNAVPNVAGGREMAFHNSIHLNDEKVGEAVTRVQARAANGPLQGSAYYDGSATFVPLDYAYARG